MIALGTIAVVAIGLLVLAADAYARSTHALDGLVDPRVLSAMRQRIARAREANRASRVTG